MFVILPAFSLNCANNEPRRDDKQEVLRVVKSEEPMLHDTLFFKSAKLIPLETTTDC